ncbi:MAG TPA: nodulation protein NfeD [Thermohalobaculum sp.]|nr:nodulation protein NfeD [Thermohalobaculum sp.]
MQIGQRFGRLVLAATALFLAVALGHGQETGERPERRVVLVAAIEGPIGPATTRHVEKMIDLAAERRAEALVLRLYTPGGLADAMRDVIAEILASPVPVIGYVAPPGAHAASAGTYILYATHVAAMAPGTNLGAATPVQIGGLPGMPGEEEEQEQANERKRDSGDSDAESDGAAGDGQAAETADETQDETDAPRSKPLSGGDAMTAKVTNDAVAFIRSLAELHGRNAEWAEKAVREAASLSASQALAQNVIDLMADDVDDLLAQADGRTVTAGGVERTLMTAQAAIELAEPDAITRLLGVLSNPNVAFILMMIGIYGLIFEFMNPGSIVPGVVGAICLTLGLYALNQLPLDYAGLALVLLGIAFMVAEALSPAFGILGFGGIVAFVIGSAMLFDTDVPEYQLSWWLIGTMAAASAGVLVLILGYTVKTYRRAPVSGVSRMLGGQAQVIDWSGSEGFVWTEGERWHAAGPPDLAAGDTVRVRRIDGLTLVVERDQPDGAQAAARSGGAEG